MPIRKVLRIKRWTREIELGQCKWPQTSIKWRVKVHHSIARVALQMNSITISVCQFDYEKKLNDRNGPGNRLNRFREFHRASPTQQQQQQLNGPALFCSHEQIKLRIMQTKTDEKHIDKQKLRSLDIQMASGCMASLTREIQRHTGDSVRWFSNVAHWTHFICIFLSLSLSHSFSTALYLVVMPSHGTHIPK